MDFQQNQSSSTHIYENNCGIMPLPNDQYQINQSINRYSGEQIFYKQHCRPQSNNSEIIQLSLPTREHNQQSKEIHNDYYKNQNQLKIVQDQIDTLNQKDFNQEIEFQQCSNRIQELEVCKQYDNNIINQNHISKQQHLINKQDQSYHNSTVKKIMKKVKTYSNNHSTFKKDRIYSQKYSNQSSSIAQKQQVCNIQQNQQSHNSNQQQNIIDNNKIFYQDTNNISNIQLENTNPQYNQQHDYYELEEKLNLQNLNQNHINQNDKININFQQPTMENQYNLKFKNFNPLDQQFHCQQQFQQNQCFKLNSDNQFLNNHINQQQCSDNNNIDFQQQIIRGQYEEYHYQYDKISDNDIYSELDIDKIRDSCEKNQVQSYQNNEFNFNSNQLQDMESNQECQQSSQNQTNQNKFNTEQEIYNYSDNFQHNFKDCDQSLNQINKFEQKNIQYNNQQQSHQYKQVHNQQKQQLIHEQFKSNQNQINHQFCTKNENNHILSINNLQNNQNNLYIDSKCFQQYQPISNNNNKICFNDNQLEIRNEFHVGQYIDKIENQQIQHCNKQQKEIIIQQSEFIRDKSIQQQNNQQVQNNKSKEIIVNKQQFNLFEQNTENLNSSLSVDLSEQDQNISIEQCFDKLSDLNVSTQEENSKNDAKSQSFIKNIQLSQNLYDYQNYDEEKFEEMDQSENVSTIQQSLISIQQTDYSNTSKDQSQHPLSDENIIQQQINNLEQEILEKKRNQKKCKICNLYYKDSSGIRNHLKSTHPRMKREDIVAEPASKNGRPRGSTKTKKKENALQNINY